MFLHFQGFPAYKFNYTKTVHLLCTFFMSFFKFSLLLETPQFPNTQITILYTWGNETFHTDNTFIAINVQTGTEQTTHRHQNIFAMQLTMCDNISIIWLYSILVNQMHQIRGLFLWLLCFLHHTVLQQRSSKNTYKKCNRSKANMQQCLVILQTLPFRTSIYNICKSLFPFTEWVVLRAAYITILLIFFGSLQSFFLHTHIAKQNSKLLLDSRMSVYEARVVFL